MLSIDGTTYAEIFGNLSARPELDDAERAAAAKIGEWFVRRDELEASGRTTRDDPDHDPLDYSGPNAMEDHDRLAPFFGPTFPEKQDGQEWRTWVCGDVRFRVWPYTAGHCMNVGVDRVSRERAAHA